jgi:glycosyl transferase family 2
MTLATLPRITIITPCRNGGSTIAEAVESIRAQHYPNLEHIVQDACSTDGTLALLQRYPEATVISEPDEGSHDAMNRGLARASGEVIGFLNVDDLYPPGVLESIGRLFADDPTLDVVVGGAVMFEDDGSGRRRVLSEWTHRRQQGLWLPELAFGVPGINGWFFRRTVFDRIGTFDNSYSFSADRRSLILIALKGLNTRLLGRPAIHYRRHAGSRTINREMANLRPITQEHVRMARELAERAGPAERRVLLAWHAFEGAKLSMRDLLSGHVREAFGLLLALFRSNPFWPLRLLHGLILRHAVGQLDARTPHEPIG